MYAYIEWDGRVYLQRKDGVLTLPEFSDELVKEMNLRVGRKMNLNGTSVVYCTSPSGGEWPLKDEVLLMPDVSEVVKRAIITSYPRPVAGGIALRENNGIEILMVRPRRGIYLGWILPGGFVEYGESPEDTLRREVEEELNLRVRDLCIVGASSRMMDNGYSLVSIFYLMSIAGEMRKRDEEIYEVMWRPVDEIKDEAIASVLDRAIEEFRRGCCAKHF